ncbi:hypothetical protein ACQCVH_14905 [Bacillus infantis]|uniref:hypothetical protein n=1 Tax=Bacillus infantis TaxID=324767 RepID=UPI003CF72BFD
MTERHEGNIEGLLKKLPPNYPVGSLYLHGSNAAVTRFSNLHNGLAYFIGEDCQVCVFDAEKVNGICFAPAEEPEGEEEEEA